MIISIEDRLASHYLERLSKNLTARLDRSGLKKPEFAAAIGMSGSQFRYIRARVANPTIRMLATIAGNLEIPLYELLEDAPLGDRRDLTAEEMIEALSVVVKHKFDRSGMSNKEFAKFIAVSVPQFYLILRGVSNPSLLAVEEIAKRVNVGIWQLLGVEPHDFGDDTTVRTVASRRAPSH